MKQKHTRKGAKTLRIWGFLFALWFVGAGLAAQSRQVTGTVSDRNGPMAGVAVSVQGTGQGTTTNAEGRYAIMASSGQTLQFSFLGYDTKEMQVGTQTVIDVDMDESALNLDEVIVIGYGTTTKRDLTGSVSSVKGEALTLSPAANPLVNIQGKVPGLDITQSSGQPGAGVDIQLRGTRSFTASGNPLFLIDGMPGDYATLNPNDILSIEVLKDASSTAVYGSSGANGVIIITTKKPQAGRVTVDFNAYYGINGWSIVPKMRGDGPGYIDALRDAAHAAGRWNSPADDKSLFEKESDYELYKEGYFMNWNKLLMQNSSVQNYSLSVAGGNERTKAYMSLNYSDERGQYKADTYKVYSTVVQVENQAARWLKAGTNVQASYVDRSRSYANLENALKMFPLGRVYNDDGSINPQPIEGQRVYNLLLNDQDGVYENVQNNFRIYVTPYIELNPIPGLSILSRANASLAYNKTMYFQGYESYQYYAADQTDASVLAQLTQNRNYNYSWENILTYNRSFNGHDFTFTGVTTWNHNQSENSYIQQTHIKENAYKWHNLDGTSTNTTATSGYSMSKGMGYVGRLNYSYDGKYLASFSIRHDGSSRLYKDTRWATFPAGSVGWRFSEENFMASTRGWLDNAKIRVSYGVTGTAGINPYSSVQELESGTMLVGGIAQDIWKFSKNVTNPHLTWEKSKTIDIGLDITVLKGRIDLVVDWYDTKTTGVIWERPLPVIYGSFGTGNTDQYVSAMNLAATKNKGWEVALNTVNIRSREVNWTSTVTYSTNKEKITKLFGGESDFLNTKDATGYVLKVGEAVKSFYGQKLNGIWQLGEEDDAAVFNAAPGDIKIDVPGMVKVGNGVFEKIGEDGEVETYDAENRYTIAGADDQILGQASPKWQLGFQNTVTYKGFDLTVYAFMRMGQMIKYGFLGDYDPKGVQNFPSYFDYWTEDNPSNKYPAINADKSISDYPGYNSLQYVDGSFFKIKNITLGYTLPEYLTKKLQISKLRVYGTITNPLVVAKSSWIKQYDPEMAGSMNYPLTKQLVFGVNFSF